MISLRDHSPQTRPPDFPRDQAIYVAFHYNYDTVSCRDDRESTKQRHSTDAVTTLEDFALCFPLSPLAWPHTVRALPSVSAVHIIVSRLPVVWCTNAQRESAKQCIIASFHLTYRLLLFRMSCDSKKKLNTPNLTYGIKPSNLPFIKESSFYRH